MTRPSVAALTAALLAAAHVAPAAAEGLPDGVALPRIEIPAARPSAPSVLPMSPMSPMAPADAPPLVEERWRESLSAFEAADKAQPPGTNGVVFVGSSSIRLWSDLEAQFGTRGIVKRGFGGSRLADCARYAQRLILPYKPRSVVVYAGDNDLAEGRSPQQVLASFQELVARVQAELPLTRIAYVSIKPSPLRAALIPAVLETNALIAKYAKTAPTLDYIDVYSRMLDAQGAPRAELFLPDALHLNAAGYAVWKQAISEHLQAASKLPAHP